MTSDYERYDVSYTTNELKNKAILSFEIYYAVCVAILLCGP